ncbi:MAG: VWA domain-containing protein [Desulfomonilia bacterium]|nr:VWA domain-containing protein [Desulfomonilia bacterium]
MIHPIIKFVACCRAAGYRISTSEVLDCLTQLELIDVLDQDEFRAVLRANFAKSRREQGEFDRLYHLFFHELRQDIEVTEQVALSGKVDRVMDILEGLANGDRSRRSILEFLSGEPLSFLEIIRQVHTEHGDSTQSVKFNLAPLAGRLEVMVNLNTIRSQIGRILEENPFRYARDTSQEVMRYFDERMRSAYSLLLKEPRPTSDDVRLIRSHEHYLTQLGDRPFTSLTPREVEQVREIIEKLVRKLKDVVSRRYSAHKRGILDIKKMLRRAHRYHGVPVEIIFKKRPPRKGKIVTLCDISSSVWAAARFMLTVLYSLQDCFTRVNSFVFVSGLVEVTEILESEEINYALGRVLKDLDLEYTAATDYGETFRQFKQNFMETLNKKTTLIIMGDARTNYLHPEDGILSEMREKCARVIWLNPEPEQIWNTGDSEMYTYKAHVNELRQCRNMNQLLGFIEELVI